MAPNPTRSHRIAHFVDGLWRACSSAQTLIVLVVLLAGTMASAAIFPQQPEGLTDAASESWLATVSGAYRSAGPFLRGIGVFQALSGPWMRALLAALALNLALRLALQAQFIRRRGHRLPPPGLPVHRETLPGRLTAQIAARQAAERLLKHFPSVVTEGDDACAQVYAERRRLGAAGPLLSYAAALLILVGLLVDDASGWRASDIALAPGGTAILTQASGLQATLTGITAETTNPQLDLTLARHGQDRSVTLSQMRPVRWGNLWLAQGAFGQALVATAQGSDGRPLLLQSLAPGGEVAQTLRVLFGQTQGEQAFAIPARNLAFRAVSYPALPERGMERPVFLVEAYRGADANPAASELVEDQTTLTVDHVTLTLRRDRYVSLEAAYLPGLFPIVAGILLALAGILLTSYLGPVRAWIGMAADRENMPVAARVAAPADGDQEVARLLAVLRPTAQEETSDAV